MTERKIKTKCKNFQQVKIVPRSNGDFLVLVVYNKESVPRVNGKYTFGIDLGIKNLMTITSDKTDFESKIVNGRSLDSLNQYLNVRLAYMQSNLPKGVYTSEAITNMLRKHNNQVEDYLHKASKLVIDLAIANDVGRIVIGYNKEWKKNMKKRKSLNRKTRMRFGSIPYLKLKQMLKYKAEDAGIEIVTIRESHTSKCSALDLEPICHHEKYMGKRSPRGRYTTAKGVRLNSDVNGSLNILRLILGNDFINRLDKGCVLQPLRLTASNSRTSIK